MTLDSYLLKYCTTREGYNDISKFLDASALSQELRAIYQTIQSYYEEYEEHTYLSSDELKSYFRVCFPTIKNQDKLDNYDLLIDRVFEAEISDSTLSRIRKQYVNRIQSQKISQAVLSGIDNGDTDFQKVQEIVEEYEEQTQAIAEEEEEESPFASKSWALVAEEEYAEDGLEWGLTAINENVGPLTGGRLGHVFAYTDTGKTTFIASQVAHFLEQLSASSQEERSILWINNEEKITKVLTKLYMAVLNATEEDLKSYEPERVEASFQENGGQHIEILDDANVTVSYIKGLVELYRPHVVVIDQGPKIKQPRIDNKSDEQERLRQLYIFYRELTKQYDCDILSVGQANGEAIGKRYLRLDMMQNAKVAIQESCDYVIGIGAEDKQPDLRYLSGCKNKSGPHWQAKAKFMPEVAHYEDY